MKTSAAMQELRSIREANSLRHLAQTPEERKQQLKASMDWFTDMMGNPPKNQGEEGLPVRFAADPFYSEANQAVLRRIIKEVDSGKAKMIVKTMDELEAMENE